MAKSKWTKLATATALIAGGAVLAACGGGGGGGGGTTTPVSVSPPPPPPPPPPPTSSAPTWDQGVFESSSEFHDQCAVPRTGTDIEGNPFPDTQGELIDELFWLRSWSDETYLWNNEIVDRDPNTFINGVGDDRLDYFDVLKTNAVTASGTPRDQFHFSQTTEEYLESRRSVPSSSYGLNYVVFSNSPPRDFRIRYTQADTPSSDVISGQPNLVRGTRILEVDGVDLVNASSQAAINTLNAGLFPATSGETHTFVVQDPGASSTRTITMTSEDISTAPVNRTRIIDTPTGKVGYILFNTFSPFASEEAIAVAMTEMRDEGVSDLVLDLRYNGGGLLAVAAQLGYMVAGPTRTNNRTFDELVINDNPLNPLIGSVGATPFYSTGLDFSLPNGAPLNALSLNRVFILSTGRTCSASEAVINGLRGVDVEVILIGGRTCGKPYGFFPTDNCGITYYTIQFGGINDKGFGEYSDGFLPNNANSNIGVKIPGCSVSDDFNNELGDPAENMLATALTYRDTSTCPSPPVQKPTEVVVAAKAGMTEVATSPQSLEEEVLMNSKDLTLPW
ncbi:MAG: S41 family peptidase [Pseudomonadota bacterium]